jgi:RNA polymerase sigma factor (sigma-70 family)
MDDEALAREFEAHRPRLTAVALRMLGSTSEADDAVQETWLRLHRSDSTGVDNLAGWLTTVVSRVCLDVLRTRTSRREEPWDALIEDVPADDRGGPEHEAVLADSVGPALLVVLDTLAPAERLAFVLHDMFAVPFDEIAAIVGRSPAAVRQLASRGRRRVQGADTAAGADPGRRRQIVAAFLAASRSGDFDALLALLAPDVVLRADPAGVAMGADAEVRGARAVAETFSGRARAARLALVDGAPGAVWAMNGTPRVVFTFRITDGRVTGIDLLADGGLLARLDLEPLDA